LKEWLFFYGVYMLGDYLAVDKGVECAALVFSYTTDAPFAFSNLTMMGTEKTIGIVLVSFAV